MQAKQLGNSRDRKLRPDWEQVKDDIMRAGVRAKFLAHPDILQTLLSTRKEELIEDAAYDSYWGCGKTGHGKNKLGKILMEVRDELRTQK